MTETQHKKANPVLLTPITHHVFDKEGRITKMHIAYSKVTTEVTIAYHVPLIDLDRMSCKLVQHFGVENSKLLFMDLAPANTPAIHTAATTILTSAS